jgi:hypothetical protein
VALLDHKQEVFRARTRSIGARIRSYRVKKEANSEIMR